MTVKQVAVRLKAEDDGSVVRMYKAAETAGVHASDATATATQRAIAAQDAQIAKLRQVTSAAEQAGAAQARIDQVTGVTGGGGAGSAKRSAAVLFAANDDYERQAQALRSVLDPAAAAQDRLNRELAEYHTLARVGAISAKELAAGQELAKNRFDATTMALSRNTAGLTRNQLASRTNLLNQVADVGVTAAMGMNPAMIAMQQGPQIMMAWSTAGIKAGGALVALGAAAAGLVGVTAGLTMAWLSGEKAALSLEKATTGLGRTSGVTAGELDTLSRAAAEQGEISVASAREQAAAYVSTGKIGSEILGGLIAVGKDYAAVMGLDAEEATQSLAKAMSDPDKAARELTRQIGLLDQATLDHIDTLIKQGDRLAAQKILLDAVTDAVDGQADRIASIESAWDAAARAVSNYWDKLGQALYTTPEERVGQLDRQIAGAQSRERSGIRLTPGFVDRLEQQRTELQFQIGYDRARDANRARAAAVNQAAQEDRDRRDAVKKPRADRSAEREAREAQRRQRAEEDAQAELARQIAAMNNDQDRVRVLEDEARVRARIRDLTDGGANADAARTQAMAEQAQLVEARAVQMDREAGAISRAASFELDRIDGLNRTIVAEERRLELLGRIEAYQKAGLTLVRAQTAAAVDQLQTDEARAAAARRAATAAETDRQLDLARLSGDDARTRDLSIEQRVRARATDLMGRSGSEMNRDDAEAEARKQIREELDAARIGGARSWAKGLAQDIRRSNIRGALSDQLDSAKDRFINGLIDGLFNIDWAGLMGGGKGGGGGWLGAAFGALFGGIGRNANGTDRWSGGPTWVGEEGPELAWMPRGAVIADSQRSRRLASGGGSGVGGPIQINLVSKLEIPAGYVPDQQLAGMFMQAHRAAVAEAVDAVNSTAPGRQLEWQIHKG